MKNIKPLKPEHRSPEILLQEVQSMDEKWESMIIIGLNEKGQVFHMTTNIDSVFACGLAHTFIDSCLRRSYIEDH